MTIFRGDLTAADCEALATLAMGDPRLSYKARGLMCTLAAALATPVSLVTINVTGLARAGADGPNSIRSGLLELASLGYLHRGRSPTTPGRRPPGRPSRADFHLAQPSPRTGSPETATPR